MEKEDLKESVLTNLRSVTQSCKGGVPLDRLQRDYREILGTPIPFRELGFNSLDAFVRSIPHVISLRRNHEGVWMAEGVADATTAHIVSLVSKQKSSDTRKRGFRRPSHSFGMRGNLSSRYSFRESPRSSHSNYNSSASRYPTRSTKPRQVVSMPKFVPPTQVPPKPLLSTPVAVKPSSTTYNSKPFKSNDQVPKYELAPRFKKLQNQNNNTSPPAVEERVSPPPAAIAQSPGRTAPVRTTPVRTTPNLSNSNNWELIPPPIMPPSQASVRPLPSRPRHIDDSQYTQLNLLESTKNAKEYVDVYSNMYNIEQFYTTVQVGQKAKNKGYVSTLCLGDKKYQSYPELKSTKEAAEEVVAKKAAEDIKKTMQEQMNSFPETPYGTTEEKKQLLCRIEEIVCEKPSGMFENGIVQEYESKFNECLPRCWPDLLLQSRFVEIDAITLANCRVPKGAKFIVRPTKELSSGNRTPSSTSSRTEFAYEDLDTGTLRNNLVDVSFPNVLDFVLPTGNNWDVYVSSVNNNISGRIIDYNDQLLKLSKEMSDFYNIESLPVTEVIEHKMYVTRDEDKPELWHRVLVDFVQEDNVSCYFVDEGDFTYVKKENLQEINPSFLILPFQAIHFILDGLEEYENFFKEELLVEALLGKSLIAVVNWWLKRPDFFPGVPGIHSTIYFVTFYDTSISLDVNMNLNEWLKDYVTALFVCKLPKLHTTSCAYLSHVTNDGRIYLRFTKSETCWLEQELQDRSSDFERAAAVECSEDLLVDRIYVAKYKGGTWHRATISENQLASSEPDTVEVFFVDFGHIDVVARSEICRLQPVSNFLASIAYQAVPCELANPFASQTFQWTKADTLKLQGCAPFNQDLIISVVTEEDGENLATVNLFKRKPDMEIVTINAMIFHKSPQFDHPAASASGKVPMKLPLQPRKSLLKNTLSRAIPDVAVPAEQMAERLVASLSSEELKWLNTPDDIKSPGALDFPSPVSLDVAPVPDDDLFNVFVIMAANPYNFVVQPLSSNNDLQKLREDMQSFYSADENQFEMDISMLRKNDFYAALHSDGTWYRVRIAEIMATNPVMVTAHYIDYGDFNQLNISNLQQLYRQFHSLPCQAIQASLSGIRPIESDWDPIHCVEFQKMVTEKIFVSDVQKKIMLTEYDIPTQKVELILIDTSTEKDIFIHQILIDRKMARPS